MQAPNQVGLLNEKNAQYVISTLNQAIDGCLSKRFDAMVTAPVQNSILNIADIPFTGHTEYLAERCHVKHVVMMLCAILQKGALGLRAPRQLRVALATTHVPLKAASATLTQKYLLDTIQIVHSDLRNKFGILNPVIRMAGLNPHAGESGYFGREEINIIAPAIKSARVLGIHVHGPLSWRYDV